MAKTPKDTTKEEAADVAPISEDATRTLITDHLIEVKRLVATLPPEPATGNAFADVEGPGTIAELRTAENSAEGKQAMVSIDAAVRDLNVAEMAVNLVSYIARRLGLVL